MKSLDHQGAELIPHPVASHMAQRAYYGTKARYGLEMPEEDESDSGVFEYVRVLGRYKGTILLTSLVGLLLGFLIGIPMKPVYRAHIALEVLNLNDDFMNMKQANQTTNTSTDFDTSEEQTQAKLLQSDALLGRVFTKLDSSSGLPVLRSKPKMATTGWRSWLHLPEYVALTEREKLLNKAADSLKTTVSAKTRVVELTTDSKDPQLAVDFANTLVSEFVQQDLESRYAASHRTSQWLTREIEDARLSLQKSEDALQAYARESRLIFTDENTNVATEKLEQVQQSLSLASADRIAKQSRYELAKSSPPQALADVLNDEGLRDLSGKIDDATRQVAQLSEIYSADFSKVKRAQAELSVLQAAFSRDRSDILNRIETDYREATRKEALLTAAYDSQAREVTGQDEKAIQYNILKREVDSNRQLYDTMLQQTKQASVASAMRASNVRVVDPAVIPDKPISPNFKINSALGLFAGFFLSTVFVTVRERADRTFQQPGEVKLWLNLQELGTIPSATAVRRLNPYVARPRVPVTKTVNFNSKNVAVGGGTRSHLVELITWKEKPSAMAEAFRSSLTSMLFIGENGKRPRVLVFTSVSPADGKTTVVSNIAIATAEIRRRVLVIDADLRRPRMHDIFNLSNERGLTDLLGEAYSEEAADSLIQQTEIPGLDVLSGGPPTEAAAHLLYSPNFTELLKQVRSRYDMVLIDTPPVQHMTDARVVGRLADAVVLVARAGKTTRDSLAVVANRFEDDQIRVLGTILNDWDPKRSTNGYYSPSYNTHYQRRYGGLEDMRRG